jgi:isoleucyl-tRNA synthetase
VPFVAEAIWQNLAVEPFGDRVAESVHLCDYPAGDPGVIDEVLSERMAMVREIVSLGHSARMEAKLKVRQPLARVEVVLAQNDHQPWLEDHAGLVREELNVKQVEYIHHAEQYVNYTVLPDLKRLGPRLGKRLPALRQKLARADAAGLRAELEARGQIVFELDGGPVALGPDDIQVRLQAKPGWAAAQGSTSVVVLSTELSEDLVGEGLARELVHAIQIFRKEQSYEYTDRIEIGVQTEAAPLRAAIETFADSIRNETLAVDLRLEALPGVEPLELDLAGHALKLHVRRK